MPSMMNFCVSFMKWSLFQILRIPPFSPMVESFLSKNFETSLTLRIVSLNLLATFLTFPDFQQAQLQQVRNHIVSLFFKSLYSKNQQVVDVARRSLQKVILFQHKLPKDLMQSGLRPVLTNLTDPKRLTVHGLEGLCRLLQLLTSYFKPEIGRKMLEHIASWSDPQVFSMACEKSLFEFNEINVIIRLVEVFPLLPNSAAVFIPDLTKSILGIEKQIKRTVSSPFRYSLAKFMSQNPTQTVLFIDENISNFEFLQLLSDILQFPVTDVLKEHLFSENFFVKLDAIFRKGPENNFPIFRIMYALFDFSLRSEHDMTKKQLLLEYFQSLLNFHLSSTRDYSTSKGTFDYLLQDIIFMILGSDFTFELVINVLLIFFRHISIDGFCPNALILCIRKWINALDDNFLSSIFLKWSDSAFNSPDNGCTFRKVTIRFLVIPAIEAMEKRVDARNFYFPERFLNTLDTKIWNSSGNLLCSEDMELGVAIFCTPFFLSKDLEEALVSFLLHSFSRNDLLSCIPSLTTLANLKNRQLAISHNLVRSIFLAFLTNFSFELRLYIPELKTFFGTILTNHDHLNIFIEVAIHVMSTEILSNPNSIPILWFVFANFGNIFETFADKILEPLLLTFSRAAISLTLSFEPTLPFTLIETLISWMHLDPSSNSLLPLCIASFRLLSSLFEFSKEVSIFQQHYKPIVAFLKSNHETASSFISLEQLLSTSLQFNFRDAPELFECVFELAHSFLWCCRESNAFNSESSVFFHFLGKFLSSNPLLSESEISPLASCIRLFFSYTLKANSETAVACINQSTEIKVSKSLPTLTYVGILRASPDYF